MANTTRTQSQLFALFPDNITRLISPQRDRDFIASAFPFLALTDPDAGNDRVDTDGIGAFFDFGNLWLNLTTGNLWRCLDGQPTAAVWSIGPAPPVFTPLLPSSLWLLGFEYLTYNGSAFQIGNGIDWCMGFWFKLALPVTTEIMVQMWDSVTAQVVEVYTSSGLLIFSGGTAFAAADINVPSPSDGLWHFLLVGYDSTGSGNVFMSIDAGPRSTAPTTGTPSGITADNVSVGVGSFMGSISLPMTGQVENLFTAGTIADTDITNLFNSGDGLFYDQVPCIFWHTLTLWFPMWEAHADRVDLVQGVHLVPVNDPLNLDSICGWRFGVPAVVTEVVEFQAGLATNTFINWTNLFVPPPSPPAGSFSIQFINGVLTIIDSSGVQTPISTPPNVQSQWVRTEVDYTQFPGTGNTLVSIQPFDSGFCYGRSMSLNTVPWLNSDSSLPAQVGLFVDNSFSDQINSIGGPSRLGVTETKIRYDGSTEDTSFHNQRYSGITTLYAGITRGSLVTTVQGHCIFWTEILFLH